MLPQSKQTPTHREPERYPRRPELQHASGPNLVAPGAACSLLSLLEPRTGRSRSSSEVMMLLLLLLLLPLLPLLLLLRLPRLQLPLVLPVLVLLRHY